MYTGDNHMDNYKYNKEIINFYSQNFYLENTPLNMYTDEKLGVKCVVMRSEDNPDEVMIASLDRPLIREFEEPVQVVLFTTLALLEDKESFSILKQLHHELMEHEYEDYFNGSVSYPGMFTPNEEVTKRFKKVAYTLQICNGGDPVFIEMEPEDENRVAFVITPLFLSEKQFDEYHKILEEEDEDEADYYILDLNEDEDLSLLK